MDKMIYDFKTHSLSYEDREIKKPIFSLMIDTLEIECMLETGEIIGVQGFLPLIKAEKKAITIGPFHEQSIRIGSVKEQEYKENMAYDLLEKEDEIKQYFGKLQIEYDEKAGIIQLGSELEKEDKTIKITHNIYGGLNMNSKLKCLYLLPDTFLE